MATDALDPSHPTGANQVQLSSELRGIKARLVADKAGIEALQVAVAPLATAGGVGLQLLADNTAHEARVDLGINPIGEDLITNYADLAALRTYLGIAGAATEVLTTTTNKGTITWPGGIKLKYSIDDIPGGGGAFAVSWDSPFTTICLGGWICKIASGDQASWLTAPPTLTGASADHNNGSTKKHITFGIGI